MLNKLHDYRFVSDEIKKIVASLDLLLTSKVVTDDMIEAHFEKISEISKSVITGGEGLPSADGLISLRVVGVDRVKAKWIVAIKCLRQYSTDYGCVGSTSVAGLAEAKYFIDKLRDRNADNGIDMMLPFRVTEEVAINMMKELEAAGIITNLTNQQPE